MRGIFHRPSALDQPVTFRPFFEKSSISTGRRLRLLISASIRNDAQADAFLLYKKTPPKPPL
jgi:hypothetical protein